MNDNIIKNLYEIENQTNLEKIWLNILNEHCEVREYNYDSELGLIINEINNKNSEIYNKIETLIEQLQKN